MVTKVKREAQTQAQIEYRRYVRSGAWICPESPTGAHHWVGENGGLICQYCLKYQHNPNSDLADLITAYTQQAEAYQGLLREEGLIR